MPSFEPKKLPTEVELILDLMPCQAMRRSYDSSERSHVCNHFQEWGLYHSFDYATAGPPPAAGIEQQSVYRGKRPLLPEPLSGCRKAPILCVGINPNLPGWWPANRSAVNPFFEDYLQYAHYFRYRATAKLRIPRPAYQAALAGAADGPEIARPLVKHGEVISLERDPVKMYLAYQTLLDALATAEGWTGHTLQVGEDLSYANMVACPSARWTVRAAEDPTMPVMGAERARGIVQECFYDRKYFLRQLFQSLPVVILVFSATTARPFITAMREHFREEGAPRDDESIDDLLGREIRLNFGRLQDGGVLDARVLFMPHASARPDEFQAVIPKVVEQLREEVAAGHLVYRLETKHLARPRGGCLFCHNEMYRIGPCDYAAELKPLERGTVTPLGVEVAGIDPEVERDAQRRMLDAFVSPPAAAPGTGHMTILDAAAPSAPSLVLFGKIVTMTRTVIDDGAIYLSKGNIDAVQQRSDPAPPGFEMAHRVETAGVIYPGLLDLHNHLSYNIMPLWNAGRIFANRNGWIKNSPDYRRTVSVPMSILAEKRKDLIKPIVRYIEAKLLVSGATSGQGMNSRFHGERLYHGLLRNFEQTDDPDLPSANHKIPDLEDKPEAIESFRRLLGKTLFFHLAEGVDQRAHGQFELLDRENLIGANLVAIHCAGLGAADFATLKAGDAKVVWSPFSNFLLYGQTLDIAGLLASGASFSLGSDWTPSGSRNLLFEMKVASLAAKAAGTPIEAMALAEAVTVRAADAAGWGAKLGTIEAGRYADLLVTDDLKPDPYETLLHTTERNVRLVVVAGHPRHGDEDLVLAAGIKAANTERVTIGGRQKRLQLWHPASPLNGLSLAEATTTLKDEMSDLERAEERAIFAPLGVEDEAWTLELDLQSALDPGEFDILAAAVPPLKSVVLDALTVIDDPTYFTALSGFAHLPDFFKRPDGLAAYYT